MSARSHVVKKAQKSQGKCGKCGTPINAGDGYRWWKFRYGGKHVRCMKPECAPTSADLESNSKKQAWNEAAEQVDTARNAEDPATAAEALRDAISTVEGITEELQGSLDAWSGTNFEYGEMAQAFESSKDALEQWASDADDWATELEGLEAPEEAGDEPTEPDREDYDDDEDGEAEYDLAYADYQTELDAWQAAEDAKGEYDDAFANALGNIEDLPDLEF